MEFVRISSKRAFGAVLLVLTVLTASVSACACTHHQPLAEEVENSCHSTRLSAASHGKLRSAEDHKTDHHSHASANGKAKNELNSENKNAFGVLCDCYVRQPLPAINSKTEAKKQHSEDITARAFTDHAFSMAVFTAGSSSTSFYLGQSIYRFDPGHSGSARAPPRL